jgi:flagellar hook-length control protein FliK
MLAISSQISDASVQEPVQPERLKFARKGGSKEPGTIGVFGRLLAGLFRKNQNPQPRGAEQVPDAVPKNDKKTKPVLTGFHVPGKKQGTEELVSSRKQLKQEKPEKAGKTPKKIGPEERNPGETLSVVMADATRAADTANAPKTGAGEAAENTKTELVTGLADEKAEKPKNQERTDFSPEKPQFSPERVQFSPVFQEKAQKDTGEIRQEETRPESSRASNRDRRKDRIAVEVRDQRTAGSRETSPDLPVQFHAAEKEFAVELRPVGERVFAGENRGAETPAVVESGSGGFADLLAEQLAGDLSPNIVKQAAILLRDGGEGTIRLSLKPETLGKVKIHLEMAENKISGHIVVDSEEALRAFEKEIHTLEQAFRDSGFTDTSLDTALSGNGGGWKEEETGPFFSERFAASSYDSASEQRAFSGGLNDGFSMVNLLV